jgi:hypothetical protein
VLVWKASNFDGVKLFIPVIPATMPGQGHSILDPVVWVRK